MNMAEALKVSITSQMPILDKAQRTYLLNQIGERVKKKIVENARRKSKGGNFWDSIANETNSKPSDGDSVVVGNSHPVARHKEVGGWIRAPGKGPGALTPPRKWLTIPVGKAKEEQKKSSDYEPGTTVFRRVNNQLALIFEVKSWKTATKGKNKGKQVPDELGDLLFVCKKAVYQKPEHWFPTEAEVMEISRKVIEKFNKMGGR